MKKVLILTLGTGNKFYNEAVQGASISEFYEKGDCVYQNTKYELNGNVQEAAFVAKPLIDELNPEAIIIIGTVKSAWTSMYSYFAATVHKDHMSDIIAIEKEYGAYTGEDCLEEAQNRLNEIFEEDDVFAGRKTAIIITKYGMNDEELEYNYKKINSIEDVLRNMGENEFDVSFDITHSFRSLPIYNLVILNYVQNITSLQLKISHIYYGNLEAKRENDGIAPIVDLKELVRILGLTAGVSEFKNTGNAVTLLPLLVEAGDDDFETAIRNFDYAVQVNSYSKLDASLKELLGAIEGHNSDEINQYADIKEMMNYVFAEKMNMSVQETSLAEQYSRMTEKDKRYMFCSWYCSQNRLGLAVATAFEYFRSVFAPFYFEVIRNSPREDYMAEALRVEAETFFRQKVGAIDKSQQFQNQLREYGLGQETDHLRKVYQYIETYKPMRNIFAHNLIADDYELYTQEGIINIVQEIHQFIETIRQLNEAFEMEDKCRKYGEVFEKSKRGYAQIRMDHGESIRLLIDKPEDDSWQKYIKRISRSEKKKHFIKYKLPNDVREYVWNSSKTLLERANFLAEYVRRFEKENQAEEIQIVYANSSHTEFCTLLKVFTENICDNVVV